MYTRRGHIANSEAPDSYQGMASSVLDLENSNIQLIYFYQNDFYQNDLFETLKMELLRGFENILWQVVILYCF